MTYANDLWVGQQVLFLYCKTSTDKELRLGVVVPSVEEYGSTLHTAVLFGNGTYREPLQEKHRKSTPESLTEERDWCTLDRCPHAHKVPA